MFDLSDAEFTVRLSAVRRALYLLFNEGYHGASGESAVRVELCHEAMRLTALLREYPPAATPETDALASLMCLHAARLPARLDSAGDLHPLIDQDRSRWDGGLVAEGLALLERSAAGRGLTAYHVEAAIAAGQRTALVAMATGTGKTRVAIALLYRLIKHGRFRRALFLVDRETLGDQAAISRRSTRSAIRNDSPGIRSIRPR